MNEKFLHYIWQHKLFNQSLFQTTDGERLEVIDVGKLNTDAGPDFFNAKVKIGDTLWAGNIEIHVNASDWHKHNHHSDKAYDSVILHLVHHSDASVSRTTGEKIPQACIPFSQQIFEQYHSLIENSIPIFCALKLQQLDSFYIRNWLDACLTDRLEIKSTHILQLLEENKNNWEEAFYVTLARNFGFGTNSDAFEMLARSLPLLYLGKHKDNLFQLEALLFGQSGLFDRIKQQDDYALSLQKEYRFLQSKYQLTPLDGSIWKMLRLRPQNFPHIRIAQFASLVHQSSKLFSKIIEHPNRQSIYSLFEVNPSEYWETHYLFGEESVSKSKQVGTMAIDVIVINTVVPFLFTYGKEKQMERLQEQAFKILEELPAEKNAVVSLWKDLGIEVDTAFHSQAVLQLKKHYCDNKKCLYCRIGHKVLSLEKS